MSSTVHGTSDNFVDEKHEAFHKEHLEEETAHVAAERGHAATDQ